MLNLKNILKEAIKDVDDNPIPGMDNAQILELPNSNFTLSLFSDEKKILFTPQDHKSLPKKVIKLINNIRTYFKISKIEPKGNGIFELIAEPREDFDAIITYIKEELASDDNL